MNDVADLAQPKTPAEIEKYKATREYQEYKKLLANREWRLDNLYWIIDEHGNEIKFVRNEAQRAYSKRRWWRDAIVKARQLGFCLEPSTRVLTSDLSWVTLDEIKLGQPIMAVDEHAPKVRGSGRKLRIGVVEAKREVFEEAFALTLDNGVRLVATGPHRFLSRKRGAVEPQWREVQNMRVGDPIRSVTQVWDAPNFDDGWFAGLLDGEGSMRQKPAGGFELSVSQVPGAVLDRARSYLTANGHTFREEIDNRKAGESSKFGNKPVHKLVMARAGEAMRLLGKLRPSRFDRSWWVGRKLPGDGSSWPKIMAIEALGKRRMIDLQTSEKTFIAEGVVSHNSTFIEIMILDLCMFKGMQAAGVVDVTLDDAKVKLEKIAFAYDRLPQNVKEGNPTTKRNTEEIHWANGSKVSVGTSYRGGTLQFLHVSEYGKISVDSPEKAKEIKLGAMKAVHATGIIAVEATAHGRGGEFYVMVEGAKARDAARTPLTALDFKLHFYGWWIKPEYRLPNNLVIITQELKDYFAEIAPKLLARHGMTLDANQMAWYAKQREDLGPDDTLSEFPTVVEETFFNSLKGAFWKNEISKARREGRIGGLVPFDPTRRVNTFWDIGEDCTALIWHQTDGLRHRLIDYYEEEGWSLQGACAMIDEKRRSRGFVYAQHLGPHDFGNKDWGNNAQTRKETAKGLGVDITVVPRIDNKADAIEAGRRMLNSTWIDQERCSLLVERLENYRKKWNKTLGLFTSDPVHDMPSHAADSYMTGACGLAPEKPEKSNRRREERRTTQWSA
jgi:hypothetical protein